MSGMTWPNDSTLIARVAAAPSWVLDVDGCIVRTAEAGGAGGVPIEGAVDLLASLEATGRTVVVGTNASQRPVAHYAAHLRKIGLDLADKDMVKAAIACADHIAAVQGQGPVVALGEDGLFEALKDAGVRIASPDDRPVAVVVGAADTDHSRDINAACLAIVDHGAAIDLTVVTPWFHGGAGRSVSISTAIARAIRDHRRAPHHLRQAFGGICPRPAGAPWSGRSGDHGRHGGFRDPHGARHGRPWRPCPVRWNERRRPALAARNRPAAPGGASCRSSAQPSDQGLNNCGRRPDMTKARFDFFHEAATPKDAEGWEKMYPHFLTPQPEGREAENSRFWFADSMHWSRAVFPYTEEHNTYFE
jgi:hypothetical protein